MKWLWSLIVLLAMPVLGQTTTVSANPVTDTDSQTWNNGNYTITFNPVPGKPGPYFYNGVPFVPQVYTGNMSNGGVLTQVLPSSNFITPSGTTWNFVICPNASAGCLTTNIAVSGSTQDITSTVDALAKGPRFAATFGAYGYLDVEIDPTPLPGGSYYNVTNLVTRCWNGSIWANCSGGGGGSPNPPEFSVQFANTLVDGFLSDPTFTFNTTTKSVEAKLLDNIPYVSQFQTGGGGNGINNFFGTNPTANTNQIAIVDNGDAGEATIFATPNGSIVDNLQTTGVFGNWFTNCTARIGFSLFPNLPFTPGASKGCNTLWANQNIATGQSTGAAATLIVNNTTEFPGYDMGNFTGAQGNDSLWAGMQTAGIGDIHWSQGISNALNISSWKYAAGDQNIFEINGQGAGGCTAASDQCITPVGINMGQVTGFPFGTVTSSAGFGDTHPVLANVSSQNSYFQGSPGGATVIDTSVVVAAGTMASSGGLYNTFGALSMSHLNTGGSGQVVSPAYTISSVAANTPVTGEATYTGVFPTCTSNQWAGGGVQISGFANSANNSPGAPNGFNIVSCTSTTLVIPNASAVNQSTSATGNALMAYPVVCTGGGGTGMNGWFVYVSASFGPVVGTVVNPPNGGQPGSGYTSTPSCVISSLANQGGAVLATFIPSFATTLHVLNIAGTTLTTTPNTCILTSYMHRSTVDMVNDTVPFTCAAETGTMDTTTNGGRVWLASDASPEMCQIMSGSQSGGTFTGTMSCHLPHIQGSMIFQGGTDGHLYLDAQAAGDSSTPGWPFIVPAYGAASPTSVIYGELFGGTQVNTSLPALGAMKASFTSPNNGFHIYKGGMVISTTNQGTTPTLNLNDMTMTAGDSYEQAPNPAFGMGALLAANVQQSVLGPFGGSEMAIFGVGPNWVFGWNALVLRNENRYGMYTSCDSSSNNLCEPITGSPGWAVGEDMIRVDGPHGNLIKTGVPFGAIISVNDTGSASYAIFDDSSNIATLQINPSADRIEIDANNTLISGNLLIGANVTANSGIFTNTVQAQNGVITGNGSFIQTATFLGSLNIGNIGSQSQPSNATINSRTYNGGTAHIGALPPSPAADLTEEGTAGTDHCRYLAFGQTPNGFSAASSPNSTSTCNLAAMGTGAAVTNASIQLISNNPGVVLATTQSCTAGQFLVAYGLSAVTAINGTILQAVSCSGTTLTAFFINGYSPTLVAPTTVTGTVTPNFVLSKWTQALGDQTVAIARTSGTAGLICSFVASYQLCADYGQGISGATPGGTDTSGSLYVGGPITNSSLPSSTSPICANGAGGALTTSGCTGGGGGSGTVTTFSAPSGSWPTWLVPSVSNPTSTPSLSVSASAIPNSALANAATTVNGQTCTLGSTCTISTGLISGLTTGFIPKASSATALNNSHIDDGVTTASTITMTEALTVNAGGVNSIQTGPNVFSALPTCTSGVEGTIALVTDSTTNIWGATITGSGSDVVMGWCNGSAWTVFAK